MLRKFEDGDTYLRAEHLLANGHYGKLTAKIARVVYGCPIQRRLKPCEGMGLEFVGIEKVLGLGITNESLVRVCTGESDPEKWAGHTLTLEVRLVRGQKTGTKQPAIRIMPKAGTMMRQGLIKELGEAIEQPVVVPEAPTTLTEDQQLFVDTTKAVIGDAQNPDELASIGEKLKQEPQIVREELRAAFAQRKKDLA